ncbi:MAG: hypothetical protein KAS72_11135 [Phycisphaerales bacterium]|nr:hypothetical protein [Phycisphaerales bacterium]
MEDLKFVRLISCKGASDQAVFLTKEEYENLIKRFDDGEGRVAIRYQRTPEDRQVHYLRIDLREWGIDSENDMPAD